MNDGRAQIHLLMQIYAESLEICVAESKKNLPLKTVMAADDVNNVVLLFDLRGKILAPLNLSSTEVKGRRQIKNWALGTARRKQEAGVYIV